VAGGKTGQETIRKFAECEEIMQEEKKKKSLSRQAPLLHAIKSLSLIHIAPLALLYSEKQ
jgi:hypothetical protein